MEQHPPCNLQQSLGLVCAALSLYFFRFGDEAFDLGFVMLGQLRWHLLVGSDKDEYLRFGAGVNKDDLFVVRVIGFPVENCCHGMTANVFGFHL